MTGRKRRYQKPNISFSDQIQNTEGMEIKLDSIEVAEWRPLSDGQGNPTQVRLSMTIEGLDMPIVIRFKGPGTLDALISALAVHRFHVWSELDT